MCFFITVIAFPEEKRNYKENFAAGYKYSDYILLRDSRSGHCLQQLWGPVTPPDGPWSPVWRSRDLHPRSMDASAGFLFGSSTSSDTVHVSQTHRGHRGLLLTDWWHAKFLFTINFYFCLNQILHIISYYLNWNLTVPNTTSLSKPTDTKAVHVRT